MPPQETNVGCSEPPKAIIAVGAKRQTWAGLGSERRKRMERPGVVYAPCPPGGRQAPGRLVAGRTRPATVPWRTRSSLRRRIGSRSHRPRTADALFEHRAHTAYSGDDDRVFCHPLTGGPLDHKAYADTLRAALTAAGITGHVRPSTTGATPRSRTRRRLVWGRRRYRPAPDTPTSRLRSGTSTLPGSRSATRR